MATRRSRLAMKATGALLESARHQQRCGSVLRRPGPELLALRRTDRLPSVTRAHCGTATTTSISPAARARADRLPVHTLVRLRSGRSDGCSRHPGSAVINVTNAASGYPATRHQLDAGFREPAVQLACVQRPVPVRHVRRSASSTRTPSATTSSSAHPVTRPAGYPTRFGRDGRTGSAGAGRRLALRLCPRPGGRDAPPRYRLNKTRVSRLPKTPPRRGFCVVSWRKPQRVLAPCASPAPGPTSPPTTCASR